MDSQTLAGKRLIVGIISIVCLAGSALLWLFGGNPETNPLLGALTRVGIVLGALWLALPRTGENIVWSRALPPVVAIVVAFAVLRRAGWWIVPLALLVAIAIVVIRPKKRPPR